MSHSQGNLVPEKTSFIRQLLFGALAMVLLASCSDSNIDGEWDLDEPEPPVVIDSSLCTEMPGRDFEEPQIVQESEDTWRIRYPLLRMSVAYTNLIRFLIWQPTIVSDGFTPMR